MNFILGKNRGSKEQFREETKNNKGSWSLIPPINMPLDQRWEHISTGAIKTLPSISQFYNYI